MRCRMATDPLMSLLLKVTARNRIHGSPREVEEDQELSRPLTGNHIDHAETRGMAVKDVLAEIGGC